MNELEEKFLEETAKPIFENYKKEVMLKLLDNEEKLKTQILEVLEKIAGRAKERNDYKIKYIDFSLLQIEFLKETYEVTAIAYVKFSNMIITRSKVPIVTSIYFSK